MNRLKKLFFLVVLFFTSLAQATPRFFFEGDGHLKLSQEEGKNLDPRLIALLDYIQDQLTKGQGKIRITSGYRSPQYNENLRSQGRLAAKASLHMEGMAADFNLSGVSGKKLWEFVRSLNCCGAGFYNGKNVHVDTGPSRFWDQNTSKVFTDISEENKQIYATTEYDIYPVNEAIKLKFVRITKYPFGVQSTFEIVSENGTFQKKISTKQKGCRTIQNPNERSLEIGPLQEVPQNQKLKIKLTFCSKPSQSMPDFILSNAFLIASPQ